MFSKYIHANRCDEQFPLMFPGCRSSHARLLERSFSQRGKELRDTDMSFDDEQFSKFRSAEESHLWNNLYRGSGAR